MTKIEGMNQNRYFLVGSVCKNLWLQLQAIFIDGTPNQGTLTEGEGSVQLTSS
jgi:hypothetical protein